MRSATATLPTFVIVGAMRSGTTSLARYIGAHPDVYMAPEKEVHFFDRYFDRGLEWYASRFAAGADTAAVGEATQVYMYDQLSVERIARVLPDARLIAILRDPVERAYSHYRLSRSLGIEPLTFPEALAAEPIRLRSADRAAKFAYSYVDRGRYVDQLARLCERFGREHVHVAIFEEMRDDPTRVYSSLCGFLGVETTFRPAFLGRPINAHVAYRSQRVRRIARNLPRPLEKVVGRLNTLRVEFGPMDASSRSFIQEELRDDIHSLEDWLGKPLPWSSSWERSPDR